MGLGKTVRGSFRRSSSAIGIVVVAAFITMMLSTTYHMLAFSRMEFIERPEVQEYENALENVSEMDDWARTQYYWSNNLSVAGICAVGTPTYFGLNTVVATNYGIGMAVAYYYHLSGPTAMLAVLAMFFIHGLLELTGIYIIAAVTMRLGWNVWKGLGRLIAITGKDGKYGAFVLTKRERREIKKHWPAIRLLLRDFITLFAIGALFIFVAAPIESYVSPAMGAIFYANPSLNALFLGLVGALYASIVLWGLKAMRRDAKSISDEVELVFKGKLRPAQLSFLMFMVFFALIMIRIMF